MLANVLESYTGNLGSVPGFHTNAPFHWGDHDREVLIVCMCLYKTPTIFHSMDRSEVASFAIPFGLIK